MASDPNADQWHFPPKGEGRILFRKPEPIEFTPEPAPDVTSVTLHAGERGDWHIPWAGITVPRGTSVRLVRDAAGRWVEVRDGVA